MELTGTHVVKEWDGTLHVVEATPAEGPDILCFDYLITYEDGLRHRVDSDYLKSIIAPSSSPWSPPPETVVSAEVKKGPERYSRLRMVATMSTGRVVELFRWYSDELHFSPWEVKGLTKVQAQQLFHDRDVAYLRS